MPRQLDDEHKLALNFPYKEVHRSDTAKANGWDNHPNTEELMAAQRHALLTLQPLRNKVGGLYVSSWLRKKQLNSALPGASPTSWHLTGLATDIISRKYSPQKLAQIVDYLELPYEEMISESFISKKTGKLVSWLHIVTCPVGSEPSKIYKVASGDRDNPTYRRVA